MKTKSIKIKLLILVLMSIFISFLILGSFNTYSSYKSEYYLIKEKELALVIDNAKFIDAFLQSKIDIIEAAANKLKKENINPDNKNLVNTFKFSKAAGNFVDVYIGFQSDGSLLTSDYTVLTVTKDNYDARKRPWYKDAVSQNKSIISKPYLDVITKKLIVSVCTPIIKEGKLVGVIGSDIFIDTIVNTVLNIKYEGEGLAYITDNDGTILIHKNKIFMKKKDFVYKTIKTNEKSTFKEISIGGVDELASYATINTTGWKLLFKLNKEIIFHELKSNLIVEVSLYLSLLLIILLVIFYSLFKMLSPLKILEDGFNYFFRYLRGEEDSIKTMNIKTNDEFGNMAKVINEQMETLAKTLEEDKELINNVKDVVNDVKNGKLDVSVVKSTINKSLNELKDILNDMIQTINHNVNKDINPILTQLEDYSQFNFKNNIPDANGDIAKGLNNLCNIINEMLQENKHNGLALEDSSKTLLSNVDVLNKASNETAVSLEETAAALEEITSTVASNTNRIQEMSNHSQELSNSIYEGQELATSTVTSMDEINEQTQAIADAITVIDQIAFQTNILSLNAAVEAATAGEAGKGFAVVAQEVRNLAARSAEAAKEIKDLVENATQKTDAGKHIADKMIQGYEKLNTNISKTTEAIKDISKASSEQKTSIEQINDVINRLDQQTQNNAAVAGQTHEVAEKTSNIAQTILEAVNSKKFRES
jgi:methyl-accepting chemotaxis protein